MSARRWWRALTLVVVTGVAAVGATGCATSPVVPGTPHASECARWDLDPDRCSEYAPVRPVAQEIMVGSDRTAASRMLCSLLDEQTWSRLAGGPIYRWIDPGERGACVVAAVTTPDQPRFSLALSTYPDAMAGYGIVDGNERTVVAGHPAWRLSRTEYGGARYTEYTVATGTDANSGGVIFVKVRADLPRGVVELPAPPPLPAYDQHAAVAETVINSLRSAA